MQLENFLYVFVLIPLAGFLLSIALPPKKEDLISGSGFAVLAIHLVLAHVFVVFWLLKGGTPLTHKELVLFKTGNYEFFLDFFFDKVTATYLIVGSFLTFLVVVYSRYYLHRERGYKRFFNTIHFFYFGYNILIFSGNLETLFMGWEVLGLSSFLLIAFYRERYLPVKNAVKVFSIYRVGDVGIILAMWLSHHLWHENITFAKLDNYELVHHQLEGHTLVGIFISMMILVAACAKSAQLPFSSWLARAMEGPTPSSAIFYGSLSVHLGVFLLMRTMHFWEHQISVRILIGLIGMFTSIVATLIARVQSSVKSQIAYASISQIGIIFIELSFGWEILALLHFAGNAFLRTYQLLVSPSVVTYLIREQFYHFQPREQTFEDTLPKKLEYTLYMLSLKEWNLDALLYRYLWEPMKTAGRKFDFLTLKRLLQITIPMFLIGLVFLATKRMVPTLFHDYVPVALAAIGVLLVLKAFVKRRNVMLAWLSVIMSHFWIALAISFNELFGFEELIIYLSGILLCGMLGFIALWRLSHLEKDFDLDRFHGFSWKYPVLAFLFLMACLGVAGFPISPSFIGEDLIFTHIHADQPVLATVVAFSIILDGLAIIRIYSRLFLGPVNEEYSRSY